MSIAELHQPSQLAELLVASDTRYFELGAETLPCDGACIAFVPSLTALPAGCVAIRLDPERALRNSRDWLAKLEAAFRSCRAALVRTYLNDDTQSLAPIFATAGYAPKLEIGFLAAPQAEACTDVQLHRVIDAADWSQKLQVHRATDIGADGYTYPAELWTELIRRKWLTGYMECFLIEFHGHIVGTIGAIDAGPLLRVKNLFVIPEFRRRGVATGALQRLSQLACQASKAAIGVFAIDHTPGYALYQSRGFCATTKQVEWTRKLI